MLLLLLLPCFQETVAEQMSCQRTWHLPLPLYSPLLPLGMKIPVLAFQSHLFPLSVAVVPVAVTVRQLAQCAFSSGFA